MSSVTPFEQAWTASERQTMAQLTSPGAIQAFLDELPYSADPIYRCPLRVLRERVAHCFDGAVFAAAALRLLGYPPLILDILPNERDDDHMLALFRRDGHWGAVAKSNFVGLRFREPIFRTLRELVLSYFENYYNVAGEKTMRGYTMPLNLDRLRPLSDRRDWMVRDEVMERIAQRLEQRRRVPVLTPQMIANLLPVDERSYRAGLMGVNEAGLYRPESQAESASETSPV